MVTAMKDDKELDEIVEKIKELVRPLDSIDAQLTVLDATFYVIVQCQIIQGTCTKEQIEKFLLDCFGMYLKSNPLPILPEPGVH